MPLSCGNVDESFSLKEFVVWAEGIARLQGQVATMADRQRPGVTEQPGSVRGNGVVPQAFVDSCGQGRLQVFDGLI